MKVAEVLVIAKAHTVLLADKNVTIPNAYVAPFAFIVHEPLAEPAATMRMPLDPAKLIIRPKASMWKIRWAHAHRRAAPARVRIDFRRVLKFRAGNSNISYRNGKKNERFNTFNPHETWQTTLSEKSDRVVFG